MKAFFYVYLYYVHLQVMKRYRLLVTTMKNLMTNQEAALGHHKGGVVSISLMAPVVLQSVVE